MTKATRIFINGFGRIGRTVLRQLLDANDIGGIEVVGINDLADPQTLAYLFKYDSAFGVWPEDVCFANGHLFAGSCSIHLTRHASLEKLDLSDVDVVLECTGKVQSHTHAKAGLEAGAGSVLISGPSEFAETTVVLGANERDLGNNTIVSNASCTTNAIAPLLRTLDLGLGIEHAHVTTIHCYTASQPTVDQAGPSFERSRAAAVSMIPTTTSAADLVTKVVPGLAERLTVAAVRVPTHSVSAIDAVVQLADWPDQPVTDFLFDAFAEDGMIGVTKDKVVSTDMRKRPESLILALPEVQILPNKQVRILGWYDNEWGFAARMIDMIELMAARQER